MNKHETNPNSTNKPLGKIKNFLKMRATPLLFITLMTGCSNTKTIKIGKGATLTTIVKDSLGLSKDITSDPKLCNILIENIAKENGIKNKDNIKIDDTIKIDMDDINNTIKKYKSNSGTTKQGEKEGENGKDGKEIKGNTGYTTINSLNEFQNSKNYLIKKIYNDNDINGKFIEALKNGYKIHFRNPIERKDSPSLSIDEITKPEKIVGNELSGLEFTLDPGHGSLDIGAVGLAQYGDESNKEKIVVYESAVMMDLTYRVARELRAHGAKVNLTHYMNKRGIMDTKDLPPCSRVFNKEGKETYQDIRSTSSKDSEGDLFNANGEYLTKRAEIANSHKTDLFISLHADILKDKNGKIDDKSSILSIKYDKRQKNPESEKIAKKIINNGFGYYFNGKLLKSVKRDVAPQLLGVLMPVKSKAILIEFGNISQESQAYTLRQHTTRENLAKNLVSSLIKVYKK